MVGKRVIATVTNKRWGYIKGDTLEITKDCEDGCYFANNLTRPEIGENKYIIICEREFKVVRNREKGDVIKEVRILGIPIYKEILKEM